MWLQYEILDEFQLIIAIKFLIIQTNASKIVEMTQ